jgi:hypothetical protein
LVDSHLPLSLVLSVQRKRRIMRIRQTPGFEAFQWTPKKNAQVGGSKVGLVSTSG